MKNGKTPRIFGIPVYLAMLGIAMGIAIGSREQLAAFFSRAYIGQDSSARNAHSRPDELHSINSVGGIEKSNDETFTISTPIEPGVQVLAADGLVFEPARTDGEFLGYRVIANNVDPRISVGDIVSAVNGVPAEDSAAGSELLIAAVNDPYAELTLYSYDRTPESSGTNE